ncbi:hypothetical protein [Kitasatospora sp. KL5]|uniref:hypothetical protein n=1 Tax=Kitasatospora sp. KL5 TaxID=3425125 RepID=UPI003D6FB6B2
MGVDIGGVIECRLWGDERWARDSPWRVVLTLDELRHGRGDRLSWDCLFGYPSTEDLVPLFDQRGLPDDATPLLRAAADEPDPVEHSHSYATWAELAAVDWDEPCTVDGLAAFHHLERWRRKTDGRLEYDGLVWTPNEVVDEAEERFGEENGHPRAWPPGACVEVGSHLFRPAVLTRRRLVFDDSQKWEPVFSIMRTLGGIHGDDNVRLIVHFG